MKREIEILDRNNQKIYGVFEYPEGYTVCKTVIFFHGSGASDRDGTVSLMGKSISENFKVISEELVKAGFAVLRYDKRDAFHIENIIEDAKTVVAYALKQKEIGDIYFFGWSEGVRVEAEIIGDFPMVKGIIMHAGIAEGWPAYFKYLLCELATKRLEELDRDKDKIVKLEDFKYFVPDATSSTFALSVLVIKAEEDGKFSIAKHLDKEGRGQFHIKEDWHPLVKEIASNPKELGKYSINPPSEEWNGFLEHIEAFTGPILILHGINDGWVNPEEAVKIAKAKRESADIVLFAGLGHSLQRVDSPLHDEGGTIEPEAILTIKDWLIKVSN